MEYRGRSMTLRMNRRLDVSLLVALLVMTALSTGIEANKQWEDNDEDTRHHPHHHSHKHHHHDDTIPDDDGEDVTSQKDNNLLPSHQHEQQVEDEEEFYDDYSSRRELFQLTDADGDGFVTREEYISQNGNNSALVNQVFSAYDGDGDGRFSEEEFLQQSSPLAVRYECEEQIIQTCDKLYLEFRTMEPKNNRVDETTCKAIQYLVDCVAGYDTDCDIMGYAQMVGNRAKTYVDSEACPLLDLHGLYKKTGQDVPNDGRKTRFARSVDDVEITTLSDQQLYEKRCSEPFIKRCSVKFRKSLISQGETEEDYCPILANFAHCLKKRGKRCLGKVDDTLLRQDMASLRKLQRAAKSCHKFHRSWARE